MNQPLRALHFIIAAGLGLGVAQLAMASDLCDSEASVASTIAAARDRGVPEAKVEEQLRQTFTIPQQQQGVLALANVIYTSPDLQQMSPEQIGGAIGSNCENHAAAKN